MATQTHRIQLPPDQDAWNFFVFRKTRDVVPAQKLLNDLRTTMHPLSTGAGSALDALVRSGELETALADAGHPDESTLINVTNALAALACGDTVDMRELLALLDQTSIAGDLRVSFPEGFSYYGLNPLDFGEVLRPSLPLRRQHAAVVGIRSVGPALAAVVLVMLRRWGVFAERTTVRPHGEPYQRSTKFTADQLAWIRTKLQDDSEFLVVDEGPGFSGSTLLSVAKALEEAGVPRENITLICSRPIDDSLARSNYGRELIHYRVLAAGYGKRVPADADRHIGNGAWRAMFYSECADWPACWTDLERIKHLSVDQNSIFKFEGLGRFGALALTQAQTLGDAGFSPLLLNMVDGFAQYRLEKGRPLNRHDISPALLMRMADYCAFRAGKLSTSSVDPNTLLNMFEVNLDVEFGCKSPLRHLEVVRPVYADCRMMPHEWVATESGRIVKTDSVGHGEGHQIPGPVDIAWDLAGAIIEWDLRQSESEFFLREYQRMSGDKATERIHDYLLLYSAYRMAHCRMGAASMREFPDGVALWNEYQRHSETLRATLVL